jgi:hypothetical protein
MVDVIDILRLFNETAGRVAARHKGEPISRRLDKLHRATTLEHRTPSDKPCKACPDRIGSTRSSVRSWLDQHRPVHPEEESEGEDPAETCTEEPGPVTAREHQWRETA